MTGRRRAVLGGALVACLCPALAAHAQVRPLATEDPQPIAPGYLLLEAGVDYLRNVAFPASGLEGHETRVGLIGLRVGLSPMVEFDVSGGVRDVLQVTGRRPAPLANLTTFSGTRTHDVDDLVLATKIRLLRETGTSPAVGFRVAVRLPNANQRSGLGLNTFDVLGGVLVGKNAGPVRLLGNLGFGILGEPTNALAQDDVLTYGAALALGRGDGVEVVGEANGRVATRRRGIAVGTESRGLARAGLRIYHGRGAWDVSIIRGLTSFDPRFGVAVGYSYRFRLFTPPTG